MNSPAGSSAPLVASGPSTLPLRLALVAYLVAVAAGFVLVFYSVIFLRAELLAGAVVSGVIAWAARAVLRESRPDGMRSEAIFDVEGGAPEESDAAESNRVRGLVNLLREWDTLEQARGSGHFDPWALQSARHEIRRAVDEDPALERLFRASR